MSLTQVRNSNRRRPDVRMACKLAILEGSNMCSALSLTLPPVSTFTPTIMGTKSKLKKFKQTLKRAYKSEDVSSNTLDQASHDTRPRAATELSISAHGEIDSASSLLPPIPTLAPSSTTSPLPEPSLPLGNESSDAIHPCPDPKLRNDTPDGAKEGPSQVRTMTLLLMFEGRLTCFRFSRQQC
jgi:hypothetical protein